MYRFDKLGSRKVFIKDVKYIGNGKAGYNKYITMYDDTQRALTKKPIKSNKPIKLNKPIINNLPKKEINLPKTETYGEINNNSIYDEFTKIITKYKNKYGNLEELEDITVDIQKLKGVKKIQNNDNSSYDLKYINNYGKKCEKNIETKIQHFENKYNLKNSVFSNINIESVVPDKNNNFFTILDIQNLNKQSVLPVKNNIEIKENNQFFSILDMQNLNTQSEVPIKNNIVIEIKKELELKTKKEEEDRINKRLEKEIEKQKENILK